MRQARVRISMSAEDGRLQAPNGSWVSFLDVPVPSINALNATTMKQKLRIARNARPYKHIEVQLALYLSAVGDQNLPPHCGIASMQLIESQDIEIQIAPGHVHEETSDVLVVTNAETRRDQFEKLQEFIQGKLSMKMDVWNLSLYGSLFQSDKEESDLRENVLSLYHGKTIIFLGNNFRFCGHELLSVLQLCDAESIFQACANGSSCLFLGSIEEQEMFRSLLFPLPQKAQDCLGSLASTSRFKELRQLLPALSEEHWSNERTYQLEANSCWYKPGSAKISHAAKRVSSALQIHMPQERFWVCPIGSAEHSNPRSIGTLLIHRGLPQSTLISTTQSRLFPGLERKSTLKLPGVPGRNPTRTGPGKTKLHLYDQYAIIGALSMKQRVDTLWATNDGAEVAGLPEEIIELIVLSTQQDLVKEIRSFLSRCSWPNSINLNEGEGKHFSAHLPAVSTLLGHPSAKTSEPPPTSILRLLHYCLAACRAQKKRHVAKQLFLPFGHRSDHLRSVLIGRIDAMLTRKGEQKDAMKRFHAKAKSLHSNWSSKKRQTLAVLAEELSATTRDSRHFLAKARYGIEDVYPRTRPWTEGEWNVQVDLVRQHDAELSAHMQSAWEERERLVLNEQEA